MKKKKFLILPLFLAVVSLWTGGITQTSDYLKTEKSELDTNTIETIASDGTFNLMVVNDGTEDQLYSWGWNNFGQLGLGDTTNRMEPTQITSLPSDVEILSIYADEGHAGAILNNQGTEEFYLWGKNDEGELGFGDSTNKLVPTQVNTIGTNTTVQNVEMSSNHLLLLVEDNGNQILYSSGNNSSGQLGIGNTTNQNTFQEITTLPNGTITKIAAGGVGHNAVIVETITGSKEYVWGENGQRQLGLGDTTDRTSPTEVTGLLTPTDNVKFLQTGYSHSGIVINDGVEDTLYMTGAGNEGQLGLGDNSFRTTYTEVTDSSLDGTITNFTIGHVHNGIVVNDGTEDHIYSWGRNVYGQLGIGNTTNQNTLQEITINLPTDGEIEAFFMGGNNSLLWINVNGKDSIYVWGDNTFGQLGIDTSVSRVDVPILIFETTITLPELYIIDENATETEVVWKYQVIDWGSNEVGDPWEYTDLTINSLVLNGIETSISYASITEPIQNIGELTLTNLEIDSTYQSNSLTVIWGTGLTQTYTIPDFATGDAVLDTDNDLPGWEAGIIGGVIGIAIIVIIGLIVWALIAVL